MAKYLFEAKAANGKDLRGEIEALSETEARVKLRAQKMVPIRVVSGEGKAAPKATASAAAKRGSINAKDLQIFTRQLSTLLASGIPIMQSIDTLSSGSKSANLNAALKGVSSDISRGKRLGDSMAEYPRIFNRFYVNMIRAGEESGNLDSILTRLAIYIEKSVKIQGKVKGAMIYPAVIIFVAMTIVTGLMIFVIPKFQGLFSSMGGELPALTQYVIATSHFFGNYWYYIFGGLFGGAFALKQYVETPAGKKVFDSVMIDLPLFGNLIQKNGVARFTRTLSTLLSSGVGILEALDIASKTVGNNVLEQAILRARNAITEGKSLTVPLAKEKYMPQMVVQMIGVGEQTGNLDQMLGKIADFYEDEVDIAVGALTQIIEPLLMVFIGIIVAIIVIAMYLPIFNMAGQVGK